MDRETQFQTVLDFRTAHKQTPQKARTVILDHRVIVHWSIAR